MTADETRAFLADHSDAVNRHDAGALAHNYAEDAVIESPIFGVVEGRDAIEASHRAAFEAWPDAIQQNESVLVDGNRACVVSTFSGTHVHDLMGLPGTGKPFKINLVFIYHLRDGLIAREERLYDFTTTLVQLGVMKVKPARG
jgi:steroid delta-isomerase-like uncharacterized protein